MRLALVFHKFSSISWCLLCWMLYSRLAMSGTLISISRWNAKAPKDVSMVWFAAHLDECTQVASALSTIWWVVSFLSLGGLVHRMITLGMPPIVWCNLSIIAFDCGFFTVVGGSLWTPNFLSRLWNFQPMNSPTLSWITTVGQAYLDSQSLLCIHSSRLVTGSMVVRALKTTALPWMVIFQGPMRSTAHCVHGASRACLGAKWLYDLPLFLYMLQLFGHWYCRMVEYWAYCVK